MTNDKDWLEANAKSSMSWMTFKVMAEFVQGFEKMDKIGPCVSIFGSARTHESHFYYQEAVKIAEKLVHHGYGVISGGGPGIMEAANRGARNANGKSVGLNIKLPFEQKSNPYIDPDKNLNFDYFFVRKVMFVKYATGFVVMPGGFGTLDEFFEAITLIQTDKINPFPIVLFGTQYWKGLLDWMKQTVLVEKYIHAENLELIKLTDSPTEVVQYINDFYAKNLNQPQI